MASSTYSWDSPGLPDREPRCPWHNGLCVYHTDDPARCPLCHATTTSGRCTCVPGDGTLTQQQLDAALRAAPALTMRELAFVHDLTPLAAKRIGHRANTLARTSRGDTEDGAA